LISKRKVNKGVHEGNDYAPENLKRDGYSAAYAAKNNDHYQIHNIDCMWYELRRSGIHISDIALHWFRNVEQCHRCPHFQAIQWNGNDHDHNTEMCCANDAFPAITQRAETDTSSGIGISESENRRRYV